MRGSGPRAGVKRKKIEATGVVVEEISLQTRMSLLTTEVTPGQTPKVDRRKQDPSLTKVHSTQRGCRNISQTLAHAKALAS